MEYERLIGDDQQHPNSPSNPLVVGDGSVTVGNMTSINSSVGGTAATVALVAPSFNLVLRNTHASQTLYFAVNGLAATTSNFAIPAGQQVEYHGVTAIPQISVIGSNSSTAYSLFAY